MKTIYLTMTLSELEALNEALAARVDEEGRAYTDKEEVNHD